MRWRDLFHERSSLDFDPWMSSMVITALPQRHSGDLESRRRHFMLMGMFWVVIQWIFPRMQWLCHMFAFSKTSIDTWIATLADQSTWMTSRTLCFCTQLNWIRQVRAQSHSSSTLKKLQQKIWSWSRVAFTTEPLKSTASETFKLFRWVNKSAI